MCAVISLSVCACGSGSGTDSETAEGGSSLFIYLCGSDLETKQGIATKALKELLTAEIPDDMNIIIQTGGAAKWRAFDISAEYPERYQVKDGELKLIERLPESKSMGSAETLADFASWCDKNYRSERNMMILWDHGAGPARGVCFDETHGYDALTLNELKDAFGQAGLQDKYDIIGFDACLMATFETVACVRDYADFMIASQEIEPSCGWGLKTVAETFSSQPDPKESGKVIIDDYINRCKAQNENDSLSTLSLFDISKIDRLIEAYNVVLNTTEDQRSVKEKKYSNVLSAVREAEHFGCTSSGYSNMVDLIDFILTLGVINEETTELITAVTNDERSGLVSYFANCGKRSNFGLSFYYPANYDAAELKEYLDLGISSIYNYLLDGIYGGDPAQTIEFADEGSVTEDGAFTVTLTPGSARYISSIDYVLLSEDENGDRIAIASDNDIHKNWDDLVFKSNFRGVTLSLDGHRLYTKTIASTSRFINFYAPVLLNGTMCSYRFNFIWNDGEFNGGHYLPGGVWVDTDENGLPVRDYETLKDGDTLLLTAGYKTEGIRTLRVPGDEIKIDSSFENRLEELPLDGKEYQYYFVVTDIFGDQFTSKLATFEMTKSYEELLKDPLPDGEYAGKVINVEDNPYAE